MPPPSPVLCIKTFGMEPAELLDHLYPFAAENGDMPLFPVNDKQLAFVQFPSMKESTECMAYINSGSIIAYNGKALTAEYSSRQQVSMPTNGTYNTMMQRPMMMMQYMGGNMGGKGGGMGMMKRPLTTPIMNVTPKRVNIEFDPSAVSPVICLKTDLSEDELFVWLEQVSTEQQLPPPIDVFVLAAKKMAFVQYSDTHQSAQALEHINSQQYETPSGLEMSAAYSRRQVIQREVSETGEQIEPRVKKPEAEPSPVLIVNLRPITKVSNFSISTEDLLAPFSHMGLVAKIIIFSKRDTSDVQTLQALVQYTELRFAQLARERMDNQVLGPFGCMVRYSERPELTVESNSERTRDYQNPWLPVSGEEMFKRD